MKLEAFKKHFTVIIVICGFVLLNIITVVWYFMPSGPQHRDNTIIPGKVVSVGETGLVTVDPRGIKKTFIITADTKYKIGKNVITVDDLTPGTFVLIEIDTATTTLQVASEVRIMTDRPKPKKTQP